MLDDVSCSSPRVILLCASPSPGALQVAAAGRSLPKDINGSSDYLSRQSASSGFSASCESNGADCSGDLSSEGDSNSNINGNVNGSSESCNTGEGVSSSDYGGGASSGSLSGDGDTLNNVVNSTQPNASCVERDSQKDELDTGSSVQSRKRSWHVSPPGVVSAPFPSRVASPRSRRSVAQKATPCGAKQTAKGSQENGLSGGGDADGDQGGDPTVDEGTSGASSPTSRILPPTARRLAMSAKKTILLRHGYDSQNGTRVDQEQQHE